jgi:hypothetical protein
MTKYRSSDGRRKRGSAFALALASSLVLAAPAHADINGFQGGDGNQVADCVTASDWQCLPSEAMHMVRDVAGAGDNTFVEGSKEDAPQTWALTADGRTSGKADVRAVWNRVSADSNRRTFLDVAFQRAENGGDTYLGLELNQSRATWTNARGTSIPCRTDGDVLVSYEVHSPPAIKLYEWTGTGPAECPDGASGSWSQAATPAATAEAAMNLGGAIPNFLATQSLGSSFALGTFGEASLDLRGLADAIDYAGTCEYFRTLTVKTRSSASVSSSLQDWVAGTDVMARSCESPTDGTGGSGGGDTTPPAKPALTAPSADGKVSCGPGVTLSGTAEAGSTVTILEGALPKEFATVAADGTWSVTVPGVSDGSHSYTAEATDAAGNTSDRSAAVTVTVDATAPAAPTLEAARAAGATVVLTGTAQPGSTVAVARDGAEVGTVTADAAGAFSLTLADVAGAHTYTATASDACATGRASAPVTLEAGTGTLGTDSGTDPGTGTTPDPGTTVDLGSTPDQGTTAGAVGLPEGATDGAATADPFPSAIDLLRGAVPANACALKPFKAYVRMKGVRAVRFMIDGRTVKVARRADKLGQYVATIDPYKLASGPHTLTARVTFAAKGRKAKTLNLRFRRCDQCESRRSFPIRVKNLRNGERAVSAVVYVNGKQARVIKGKRLRSRVVLAGLPKGSYTVRIVTRTNRGRTSTEVRRYRTCVPKPAAR